MKKKLAPLILFLTFSGCAHSTITPFQPVVSEKSQGYPPTRPEDVGVYRTLNPFSSFIELGMISYRSYEFDLVQLYNQIRRDSASYGAQAVVDVNTTAETHIEFEPQTSCIPSTTCNPDGNCTTQNQCHTEQVPVPISTFLIVGSMIRGKP